MIVEIEVGIRRSAVEHLAEHRKQPRLRVAWTTVLHHPRSRRKVTMRMRPWSAASKPSRKNGFSVSAESQLSVDAPAPRVRQIETDCLHRPAATFRDNGLHALCQALSRDRPRNSRRERRKYTKTLFLSPMTFSSVLRWTDAP